MTTLLSPVHNGSPANLGLNAMPHSTPVADPTLHRPIAGWQMDRTTSRNERADSPQEAVDMMALLGRCLGNFELIVRVLGRFRKTGATDLEQLGCAIEGSDFAAVVEIAHRFKGAAGNISAAGLHRIAAGMEQLAREQKADQLPELLSQLEAEWERFLRFADAFAPPVGASSVLPVK